MVSPALLEELKIIIKEDYGVDLNQNELAQISDSLLKFFSLRLELLKDKNENEYGSTKSK